jgi:hypothetical protein
MEIEFIAPAIIGTVVSLISLLLAMWRRREEIVKHLKEKEEIRSKVSEIGINLGLIRITQRIGTQSNDLDTDQLVAQIENRIYQRLQDSPSQDDEQIRDTIQSELVGFQDRMKKIEDRFPDESKIEKISSINDALLSERIDQLKERLDQVEKQTLTKWDVAIVVSMMIGGICFVVGATYAIIEFLSKTPTAT